MTITLPNQTAVGSAKYEIIINDTDGWEETVQFVANDK